MLLFPMACHTASTALQTEADRLLATAVVGVGHFPVWTSTYAGNFPVAG